MGPSVESTREINNMQTFKQFYEQKQKGVDGKACWKGYKRVGTKKKGDKTVDNCVKVNEKSSKCTGPTKKASSTSKGKKYMKCVKSDSGGYKRIHWGQKGAKASSGNSKWLYTKKHGLIYYDRTHKNYYYKKDYGWLYIKDGLTYDFVKKRWLNE